MVSGKKTDSRATAFVLGVVNLDAVAARRLRLEVLPIVGAGGSVVLDMGGIEFADSSGLGAICALKKASEQGGLVVLARCSRRLETILAKVPEGRLPERFTTLGEAAEAVSRHLKTDVVMSDFISPIVAFPIRQAAAPTDNRWNHKDLLAHAHAD